ncbi:MAG TPA: hypothetical protein VGF28_04795 [Thermoanaerobaculia bacterium]|jgi:hypothetical protein
MLKRILGVVLVATTVAGAGDVLQQLSVPKGEAAKDVVSAFAYGNVNFYRVREAFKKATPAARAAMTEQVLAWTKAYVSSPQFAKDYAAFRAEAKPEGEAGGLTVDQELEQRRAQRKAELEEARKAVAETPAEYRGMAEEGYKAAVETAKQFDTPEFRKMEREQIIEERKARAEDSREELARWEAEYPADPKALVKKRLTEFLRETEGVDYAAQLVNKGSRMRFANAAYEQQSSEWKLAYRAGKDATEKARAFAKAWLGELK